VHLIADEIAVGFGRTGTMFACEQADVAPDFLCLSKGITGGYLPLSVVMTTDAVYAAFYDPSLSRGFLHSHSYTGNPLACRAALAVLAVLTDEQRIARNIGLRDWMNRRIASWQTHPGITQLRNTGMIWAFELTDPRADAGARFHRQALLQGILLRPIGRTVYWMPPYAVDEESLEFLAAGIERVLGAG
jgi:adenosylmethionine-8-amino-7-oxononanoate aminotransferase